MLEHLRKKIASNEARQSELDAEIAALDEQICVLTARARDNAGDGLVVDRMGAMYRQLADLLYELGRIDTRLEEARDRAGALAAPPRSAPSQRLRAWARR